MTFGIRLKRFMLMTIRWRNVNNNTRILQGQSAHINWYPMKASQNVHHFLQTLTHDSSPQITALQRGYGSNAYKVEFSDRSPLVILEEKAHAHAEPAYGHYFALVKLLQQKGYDFVPTEIHISDDQQLLAIEFIDGWAIDEAPQLKDPDQALELFKYVFDLALSLKSIDYDDYLHVCAQHNIEPKQQITYEQSIRSFAEGWLETVDKDCPDEDLRQWCLHYVTKSLKESAEMFTDAKPVLIHGDLSEGNILIEKSTNKIFLIDWGAADFMTIGDEFYAAYCTNVVLAMHPHRNEIIEYIAQKGGHDLEEFKVQSRRMMLNINPLDTLWAIMMYTKACKNPEVGDPQYFKDIAIRRVGEYENLLKESD